MNSSCLIIFVVFLRLAYCSQGCQMLTLSVSEGVNRVCLTYCLLSQQKKQSALLVCQNQKTQFFFLTDQSAIPLKGAAVMSSSSVRLEIHLKLQKHHQGETPLQVFILCYFVFREEKIIKLILEINLLLLFQQKMDCLN